MQFKAIKKLVWLWTSKHNSWESSSYPPTLKIAYKDNNSLLTPSHHISNQSGNENYNSLINNKIYFIISCTVMDKLTRTRRKCKRGSCSCPICYKSQTRIITMQANSFAANISHLQQTSVILILFFQVLEARKEKFYTFCWARYRRSHTHIDRLISIILNTAKRSEIHNSLSLPHKMDNEDCTDHDIFREVTGD